MDPKSNLQVTAKYAIDRIAAILMLLIFAPLVLLIGLMIRLDSPGPVFFRQERLGLAAKPFRVWKFRTMVVNADAMLDENGRVADQDRITRTGRVLRTLSLDELPQLLNIGRGEMSFVGPRPVLPEHYARYSARQLGRFEMKPGITGLAQVNGRNTLRWTRRLEYDVEYVHSFNLLLDARILIKTIKVWILREGIVLDRNPEQVDDLPPQASEHDRGCSSSRGRSNA